MNFSELFKHTGQLCKFSPDGQFLASVVQYRVVIRDVRTLQITQLYTCLDTVQLIEWSADSQFILCGMFKRSLVQVWSIEDPTWACKIDEGSAGLADVRWSPDARHILTTADFQLRVTVWSMVSKSVSYIKYPKACQKGMDFSHDGKYLALAERRDCKDYMSIFATESWELVKHFDTQTEDLSCVMWSPDGRVLAVWESALCYKILLYSMDGRCLAVYTAYENALGIKSAVWSATSQFLAMGSFDQKVRLLNHVTWRTVAEFSHKPVIDSDNVIIYKEAETCPPLLKGETRPPAGSLFNIQCKYELQTAPVQVPVVKPDLEKANPKLGVGIVAFSHDCRYMYTRNDNMPHTLWIWDIQKLSLAVILIQAAPIKAVSWDPRQSRLALCTGNNKVYMWSPAGSLCVEVPVQGTFLVQSVTWHPDGQAFLLVSKTDMCVCFLNATAEQQQQQHQITA